MHCIQASVGDHGLQHIDDIVFNDANIGERELLDLSEQGADPWNVLDDHAKLTLLSNMLTKEVEAVTASLLTQ